MAKWDVCLESLDIKPYLGFVGLKKDFTYMCLEFDSSQLTFQSHDVNFQGRSKSKYKLKQTHRSKKLELVRKHCSLEASFNAGIVTFGCVNNARQSLADE